MIDDTGNWVNREEYTPYGETSFGSFARKRYRFTGKERDEESGLNYHGARYYAPWLGRWTSCDPAGTVDGPNLYAYVADNPIRLIDPAGTGSMDSSGGPASPDTTNVPSSANSGVGSGGALPSTGAKPEPANQGQTAARGTDTISTNVHDLPDASITPSDLPNAASARRGGRGWRRANAGPDARDAGARWVRRRACRTYPRRRRDRGCSDQRVPKRWLAGTLRPPPRSQPPHRALQALPPSAWWGRS